jgi:hypothetical protein
MIEIIGSKGVFGSLSDAVREYALWLEVMAPDHASAFKARLDADPEAAQAEAAVFTLLRAQRLDPFPVEDLGTGGADFLCRKSDAREGITVEVTAIKGNAVAARSGLPTTVGEDPRWFSQITEMLMSRAKRKAPQLGQQTGARVLAICLRHDYADLLMGALAAKWLMCGKPRISVPRDTSEDSEPKEVTSLRESAFMRPDQAGNVEACRRSISAILLIELSDDSQKVIGLLHPDPAIPLVYELLFPIPFLAVTNWPLTRGDNIRLEWRLPEKDPDPHLFFYELPLLTDYELKVEQRG